MLSDCHSLLDATRAAVLAVGPRRTTLSDVARRAGVSRMTVYRQVPDVTSLLTQLMTRELVALLTAARAAVDEEASGRAQLVECALSVVDRLPNEPLFRRVVEVDPQLLLPYLTERLGSTQRAALDVIHDLVVAGQADGSIRCADPDALSWTVLLAVSAFVVSSPILTAEADPATIHGELRQLLDAGLAPTAAPLRAPGSTRSRRRSRAQP